jgi:hypothetical protein
LVERSIFLFAILEHSLRCRLQIWYASKVGFQEARQPNPKLSQFLLYYNIDMFTMFGGIAKLPVLRTHGVCWTDVGGRGGGVGCGDGVADSVPNGFVGLLLRTASRRGLICTVSNL